MNKEFVPYTEALALKELGFDEPCFAIYEDKKWQLFEVKNSISYESCLKLDVFPVPTFSQAFRWFREKYNICGWVQESYFRGLKFHQYHISRVEILNVISDLSECSYEEAELECLKKLIEIVKNKSH